MPSDAAKLRETIVESCLAMGFARAGIASAEPSAWREQYLAWLSAGKHGGMAYLTEYLDERLDVRKLLPGARSVIIVADQYARREEVHTPGMRPPRPIPVDQARLPVGVIARYARGRDYHAVMKSRLHDLSDALRATHAGGGAKFRPFVDTGPAMEREHALRAGLGFIGKHTLLIEPRLGSWLLLGGIATTLDLAAAATPAEAKTDHCGTCSACIDACPTGAISPWSVDATRCISYLTLEHRGPIDEQFHAAIGDRLVGCDVCQDVCPFNHAHAESAPSDRVNPAYADRDGGRLSLPVLDILAWSEVDRARILTGSAAKRASLDMLKRNASIVAGNACEESSQPAVPAALAGVRDNPQESELVRQTAAAVLARRGLSRPCK